MFLFERNALVTISPKYDNVPEGATRFRWGMHVSLPFPFPSQKCIHLTPTIRDVAYDFSIHNHFDRLFVGPKSGPAMPRVWLHDRNKMLPDNLAECNVNREFLQSVAIFQESTEHSSPNDAFADAAGKIEACFSYLADYLGRRQAAAPYLTAWLVYPISLFDVGTVYHTVQSFCENHKQWQVFASAPAISLARRLQHPLFFLEADEGLNEEDPLHALIQASNELLAEAQMSLFRGLPRRTILNSYGAVESLANAVFKKTKTELLLSSNVPREMAERLVEEERQRHRTEPSFLYHRGLQDSCNRSLATEDKDMYDRILELQRTRHQVAHAGYKPSVDQARSAHKLACECAQWLANVGGLPEKPLLPANEAQVPGFSGVASDTHAINAGEFEFLRHAMGFVTPEVTASDNDAE